MTTHHERQADHGILLQTLGHIGTIFELQRLLGDDAHFDEYGRAVGDPVAVRRIWGQRQAHKATLAARVAAQADEQRRADEAAEAARAAARDAAAGGVGPPPERQAQYGAVRPAPVQNQLLSPREQLARREQQLAEAANR